MMETNKQNTHKKRKVEKHGQIRGSNIQELFLITISPTLLIATESDMLFCIIHCSFLFQNIVYSMCVFDIFLSLL